MSRTIAGPPDGNVDLDDRYETTNLVEIEFYEHNVLDGGGHDVASVPYVSEANL